MSASKVKPRYFFALSSEGAGDVKFKAPEEYPIGLASHIFRDWASNEGWSRIGSYKVRLASKEEYNKSELFQIDIFNGEFIFEEDSDKKIKIQMKSKVKP